MLPKIKALALVCLLLALGTNALLAQLTANAGHDTTICVGDTVILGGTPTATGGTPPYTYNWGPSASISSVTISNPYTTTNVTTTYTVTVTDNLNNTATASITVTVNPLPQLDFWDSNSFNLCYGAHNASLCVNVVGQAPPYTYAWSNGSTTQCLTSLAAGSYAVTFTDTNGCRASASTSISQPAQLLDSLHDLACNTNNGVIEAIVWGGTAPYEYQWSDGETGAGINAQVNSTYQVTITDANGCTINDTNTLHYTGLTMTIDSLHVTNVNCASANNGAICVYTSGTGTFTYRWSDFSTGQCITGLGAGTYVVSATSSYGCTATASGTVSQPTQISVTLTVNNEPCYGQSLGSVTASVTGGTAPYMYLWSNSVTVQSITNLSAGTYIFSATDNNGCTVSRSAMVTQPTQLVIDTIYTGGGTCGTNNGTLTPEVSGGTPGYTFAWSGGAGTFQNPTGLAAGTYCLTVTDVNGCSAAGCSTISTSPGIVIDSVHVTNLTCYGGNNGGLCVYATGAGSFTYNWSNTATGQCITNAETATYTVTVTNTSGCSATASATIAQPAQLIIDSLPITYVNCVANSAAITPYVEGGTGPYSYLWSNGETIVPITNLSVGPYVLTVTDANACITTGSAFVNQPSAVTIDSLHVTNVSCHNTATGSVCVYATGLGGPNPYLWSNAETSQCNTGLAPGAYAITVTSSSGCTASAIATVAQPTILKDSIAVGSCSLCDYPSGGTPPYSYIWSNGSTTACITDVTAGTWISWVSDSLGCIIADTALTVNNVQFQVFTPDTNAVPDSVSLLISGGLAPYSVVWGDGQLTTEIDSATLHIYSTTGFYYLHIQDSLGCTSTQYRVDAGCSDQCVWPGDANYDGIVDNNDLLPIGLGYDSTGFPRLHPTIDFIPQYCQSWVDTIMGGINYKHIDCNGDGVINAADTDAIVLNYGFRHVRSSGRPAWKSDAPGLYVSVSPDTLVDGQIATATLSLGDSAIPANNVYALAFTYNFDPLVVDTGSVSINFGNSWLAGNGDHINISKNFYGPGQVQAALTRINHLTRSGQGTIATVSMKITTGNINGKNLQYYILNNFISNLTVIDNLGNVLPFNEGTDSAEIAFIPTNVKPIPNSTHIQIFPNPATDQLNITAGAAGIEDVSIADLTGQLVYHQIAGITTNLTIDISQLSAGVYTLQLKAPGGEYHSRFVKINVK